MITAGKTIRAIKKDKRVSTTSYPAIIWHLLFLVVSCLYNISLGEARILGKYTIFFSLLIAKNMGKLPMNCPL